MERKIKAVSLRPRAVLALTTVFLMLLTILGFAALPQVAGAETPVPIAKQETQEANLAPESAIDTEPSGHIFNSHKWKTECNTAQTGIDGCQSFARASVTAIETTKFDRIKNWVLQNILLFITSSRPVPPTTAPTTSTAPVPTTTAPTTSTAPVPTTTAKPTAPATGTLMGWELTANNVGLAQFGQKCDDLPLYTGSLQPAAGTTISGKLIVGNLDLRNGDIIVERSCIKTGSNPSRQAMVANYVCGANDCSVTSDKSVIIRDSEFDASQAQASQISTTCAFRGTATLQRNYIHGMGSGICFFNTGRTHDAIADQNFVTDLRSYGDSHNEAATIRDFVMDSNPNRVARFSRNRFFIAGGNVTAGLFIQPTFADIDSILVEGNLIEGAGYNLYLDEQREGTYSNARAINNRFRSTGWGPTVADGGKGWAEWRDNYTFDPTKPSAAGTIVNAKR